MTLVELLLPKLRDLLFFAFADGALVVVAKSLLGPERALTFKVYFVCAEVRCPFELV